MNHQYKLLHQNDCGYISCCNSCLHLQLGVGNMIHCMKDSDLKKMSNAICRIEGHLEMDDFSDAECVLPNGQKILMQSPDKSIFFAFTRSEFVLLKELVENAMLMIEVKKTLSN